jgi:transcriptional regulator of heat shock response
LYPEKIDKGHDVLTKRQQKVLTALVDEYVVSATPVGSGRIAEHYFKEVSSATIRNELMGLVAGGYAVSPHTSAGRVPTNIGYRVVVNNILLRGDFTRATGSPELDALSTSEEIQNIDQERRISRVLSQVSENTGLLSMYWSFKPDSVVYHRGLPQLLAQPEFQETSAVIPLMRLLEDERALNDLFLSTLKSNGFVVKIGMEESEGHLSSYSMVAEVIGGDQPNSFLAVFGPTRMDYRRVIPNVFLAARLLGSPLKRVPGL